jgi:hypothetical protein
MTFEPPKKKINYLSNKELLKELFKSKLSFCSFKNEKYNHYDMILSSVGEITPDKIMKAKRARFQYMTEKQIEELISKGMTPRQAEEWLNNKKNKKKKVKLKDVQKEDICFRIMTFEHIPENILENPKAIYSKLYFHPFKHFAYIRGSWKEVGRSHWNGDFKSGNFNANKGKLTDRLVKSLMMLVDKYSQKGNFRNYSYLDDMKGQALLQLSQIALQFDENRSNNPFAFYTTCIHHSFVKILKQEKKVRTIRDDLITFEGFNASTNYQLENEDKDVGSFYTEELGAPTVVAELDVDKVVKKGKKT